MCQMCTVGEAHWRIHILLLMDCPFNKCSAWFYNRKFYECRWVPKDIILLCLDPLENVWLNYGIHVREKENLMPICGTRRSIYKHRFFSVPASFFQCRDVCYFVALYSASYDDVCSINVHFWNEATQNSARKIARKLLIALWTQIANDPALVVCSTADSLFNRDVGKCIEATYPRWYPSSKTLSKYVTVWRLLLLGLRNRFIDFESTIVSRVGVLCFFFFFFLSNARHFF